MTGQRGSRRRPIPADAGLADPKEAPRYKDAGLLDVPLGAAGISLPG